MNGMQRLAQAERDNVDLHEALAEALLRLSRANDLLGPELRIDTRDLFEVFDRTSRIAAE